MDKVDKYFVEYCMNHFTDLNGEFGEAFGRLLHKYQMMRNMDPSELEDLLRITYHEYLKGPHPDDINFNEYMSWTSPLAKKILEQ